jgi:aminoglycoside phosphotransferase (APT) family kinase protein
VHTFAERDEPSACAGRATVGFEPEAVSAWLGRLAVGARPPLSYSRLGFGQSNLTFLVTDAAGRRCVLRRPPLGPLLASAHDVEREHRILSSLQESPVPSPGVLGLCTEPDVSDAPLLAMEYVDGVVVDGVRVAETLPPGRRRRIGFALVDALAAIHDVDLERTRLSGLSSHAPYAQRQLKRWQRQWQSSRTRELPDIDELSERLWAAVPPQRELTLVHGDFHLRNVVVAPFTGRVRAVLDWELCTLGEPLADLGGLLAYWPHAGEPGAMSLSPSALLGFPSRPELAHAYAKRTGRSLEALGYWHVLALWKLAIIAEGVVRRALDEPRNAALGAAIDIHTVDDLVGRAIRLADLEGI